MDLQDTDVTDFCPVNLPVQSEMKVPTNLAFSMRKITFWSSLLVASIYATSVSGANSQLQEITARKCCLLQVF